MVISHVPVRSSSRPFLFALALCLAPALAQAQQPKEPPPAAAPQSEINRANALGHEGRAAYEAGRFAEALEKFRAADRIVHSPVLALHVARCERNLGRLVAARASYRAIVDEPLAESAPQAFLAARADAERELAALIPKIPALRPIVPDGATGELVIDGIAVSLAEAGSGVAVDPGEHEITWRSAKGSPVTRKVRVDEGAAPLTVDLRSAAPEPVAPPPPRAPTDAPPARTGGTLVPGLIVTGVGVAALGVGAVTGLVAMSETSDIESRCDGTRCDPRDADQADSARSLAAVSTVGFVAGGILTAGGIVLLVTLGAGDDDDGAARAPGPRLTVAARPTRAELELVF